MKKSDQKLLDRIRELAIDLRDFPMCRQEDVYSFIEITVPFLENIKQINNDEINNMISDIDPEVYHFSGVCSVRARLLAVVDFVERHSDEELIVSRAATRKGQLQTAIEITPGAWRGISALIELKINDGSFGAEFPDMCPDGNAVCGTDADLFWKMLGAEIPALAGEERSVLYRQEPPTFLHAMHMIQFCWKSVGLVKQGEYHSFFKHHHITFDPGAGRAEFQDRINDIFQHNGMACRLTGAGRIELLTPREIADILHSATEFKTGDSELNNMLEEARQKFQGPDEDMRREALKILWDVWERVKTLNGKDKKSGIATILDQVAGATGTKFRAMIEKEARALTDIGNMFHIRHSETTQERLEDADHIDYLFHRLFSLMYLILHRITSQSNEGDQETSETDDDIPF